MSTPKSAYPVPVEELLPRACELAQHLGEVPSRNRLMSEFRIGARKANEILKQLGTTGAGNDESAESGTAPRLHLVAGLESTDASDEPTQPLPIVETVPAESADDAGSAPAPERGPASPSDPASEEASEQAAAGANPASRSGATAGSPWTESVPVWPVVLLALPAFVSIWSGWVGLGGLTGFGMVHPLPGIWDTVQLNSAITLPIGVETYAAYALRVWLSGRVPPRARRFAKVSALGSLILGALGQVAYHLMTAAGMTTAPWWITTLVACLPVAVLGMGAALTHLLRTDTTPAPEVP